MLCNFMDSIKEIRERLSEIDILLEDAIKNQTLITKYQLYLKTSIVLLSTKFEVFLEDFIEEHSQRLLNGHTNLSFPSKLKDIYFDSGIEMIFKEKKRQKKKTLFQSLMILLQTDYHSISPLNSIRPSMKFNYGKHGEKEIKALFERHGLGEFVKKEDLRVCFEKINSLISIRNNVIHQDASPSLTHQTVKEHKDNILFFIQQLENEIEEKKRDYYNEE